MSRLTEWKNGELLVKEEERLLNANGVITKDEMYKIMRHLAEKLADYEDKEEQGLLLELKVPLGTKIWYLSYEEDYEQGWWDIDCGIYSLAWIHYHENKEFYLTRSKAEEALAKMEGKA